MSLVGLPGDAGTRLLSGPATDAGAESLAVIGWHQRLAEMFDGSQFRFLKEMKAAIPGLKLH